MGLGDSINDQLKLDWDKLKLQLLQTKRDNQRLQTVNSGLLSQILELEKTLERIDETLSSDFLPPKWLTEPPSNRKKHATLTLILSDTHFDEMVNPDEIGGLNAYNRRIAELRLQAWTQNAIKIARHYLAGMTYDGVVLLLGGDIFSGDIHEELAQTNEDTMLGSLLHWAEQLAGAIDQLTEEFGKVHVAVVMGNHGRMTRKPRAKLRAKTNFDWLLGKMLERHYAKEKRVTFQVSENADCLVPIYGWGHLLTHGDQVSGGGGIGGIWPPIMRMRARKAQRAMDIGAPFHTLWMGHWHQLIQTPHLVVNGSLKGTDEYSWVSNFGHEPPQQALAIVTPEHNITLQAPIFVVDRKKEKW